MINGLNKPLNEIYSRFAFSHLERKTQDSGISAISPPIFNILLATLTDKDSNLAMSHQAQYRMTNFLNQLPQDGDVKLFAHALSKIITSNKDPETQRIHINHAYTDAVVKRISVFDDMITTQRDNKDLNAAMEIRDFKKTFIEMFAPYLSKDCDNTPSSGNTTPTVHQFTPHLQAM